MPLRLIPEIHRATHRIAVYLARRPALGLSQGEAHILAHLANFDASTINELHRAFAHKRSTLTSILDRLVARKLVTRTIGKKDRRTFVVRLTASGKLLAKRAYREFAALEKRARMRLSPKQLEGFMDTMHALERVLED